MPQGEVIEMNRRLAGVDTSLNAPMGVEGDSEWLEMLPDERPNQETRIADAEEMQLRRHSLDYALKQLKPREREIIFARRIQDEPLTLEELSHRYAVSRERIRQIEVRAFGKLQRAMRANNQLTRQDNNRLAAA